MEPGAVIKDKESGGFLLEVPPCTLNLFLFYYHFWVQDILCHV